MSDTRQTLLTALENECNSAWFARAKKLTPFLCALLVAVVLWALHVITL